MGLGFRVGVVMSTVAVLKAATMISTTVAVGTRAKTQLRGRKRTRRQVKPLNVSNLSDYTSLHLNSNPKPKHNKFNHEP